ncbi:globin-like protein [Scenedesmus sp. NREL 46B-D3]|nr:globin-like protein [Scenedesmus sp. NREL 46B-D3]
MLASMRTSRLAAAAPTRPSRTAVVLNFKNERRHAPLIDRLGGPDAVKSAVDIFYGKVLDDSRIKHYFAGTDMKKQRAHQAAFMTYAFGGATKYAGKDMAEAHRHLVPHLTEEHFNAVVENFVATLQELGVAQEDIDDACKVVASTKDAVLAR